MKEVSLNTENFKNIMTSDKTVLLDFYADWCGPCKMLSPIISEIADERDDVIVGKINVDLEQDLARQFNVSSIPTLVLIKNGSVVKKSVGFIPKNQIETMINEA